MFPHIDRAEPGYQHIHATDGGEADIYADVDGDSFTGLMLSHCSDGQVLDLLAEFARRVDAVIMPVGCPTLLTAPDQRDHLPDNLRTAHPTILIATGHDIAAAIHAA